MKLGVCSQYSARKSSTPRIRDQKRKNLPVTEQNLLKIDWASQTWVWKCPGSHIVPNRSVCILTPELPRWPCDPHRQSLIRWIRISVTVTAAHESTAQIKEPGKAKSEMGFCVRFIRWRVRCLGKHDPAQRKTLTYFRRCPGKLALGESPASTTEEVDLRN